MGSPSVVRHGRLGIAWRQLGGHGVAAGGAIGRVALPRSSLGAGAAVGSAGLQRYGASSPGMLPAGLISPGP